MYAHVTHAQKKSTKQPDVAHPSGNEEEEKVVVVVVVVVVPNWSLLTIHLHLLILILYFPHINIKHQISTTSILSAAVRKIMESTGRPAEPIAVGVWATAKQSFSDLFKWEQRVKITNEYGESRTEWQRPLPLRNPISLLAQLTPTAWVFFIVGFASWTVRVCVFV